MSIVNFKKEYLDSISKTFNLFNRKITTTLNETINTWDENSLVILLDELKDEYLLLQDNIRYFFVEIRQSLLLLDNKEKEVYKRYFNIALKGIGNLITPEKIEEIVEHNLGFSLEFEDSYYSADLIVENPDRYIVVNHLYTYSLMLCYYYALIKNIGDNLHKTNFSDSSLDSLDTDSKKNKIKEKLLLIYYLANQQKISLSKISQDTTKQARIFSFLFDNSYENLRKDLALVEESKVKELKTANNLKKSLDLVAKMGGEYLTIKELIEKDLKNLEEK